MRRGAKSCCPKQNRVLLRLVWVQVNSLALERGLLPLQVFERRSRIAYLGDAAAVRSQLQGGFPLAHSIAGVGPLKCDLRRSHHPGSCSLEGRPGKAKPSRSAPPIPSKPPTHTKRKRTQNSRSGIPLEGFPRFVLYSPFGNPSPRRQGEIQTYPRLYRSDIHPFDPFIRG